MDAEKLEALNKAKSKQITRLELENEQLKKQIRHVDGELESIKNKNTRIHENNLILQGQVKSLKEIILLLFAREISNSYGE